MQEKVLLKMIKELNKLIVNEEDKISIDDNGLIPDETRQSVVLRNVASS